ncbi:MAG: Holliday junction resolvase RuvX [Bdellovibrio sp.]|nr:Holliday junction resolvase RuvX [Bdellovibrio sp.]
MSSNNDSPSLCSLGLESGDTLLAIDYGQKRVGLATFTLKSDPYPLPYRCLLVKDNPSLISELKAIIQAENIRALVLGIPHLTDGKTTAMTTKIGQFGRQLTKIFPHLLYFEQDETLSSFEAEDRMKKSARYNFKIKRDELDALAASIILEDFLKRFPNSR